MSELPGVADSALMTATLRVLDDNRTMCVATVRPDGWPQATTVGFVHDELTIYFAVAATSQKLANIQRDPRVSIAIGRESPDHICGLSMAATASPVSDGEEIARLNKLLGERYREQWVFAPRETSSALLKATPRFISLIDHSKGPGPAQLMRMTNASELHLVG